MFYVILWEYGAPIYIKYKYLHSLTSRKNSGSTPHEFTMGRLVYYGLEVRPWFCIIFQQYDIGILVGRPNLMI